MPVGTQQNPIRTKEPMKVARALLADRFKPPEGGRGLHHYNGDFFEWYGNRWVLRDREWLKRIIWRWLEDAWVSADQEGLAVTRFSPTQTKVEGIIDALLAVCTLEQQRVPMWVRNTLKKMPPTTRMIAFEDVLIDVANHKAITRDSNWFDTLVLPVNFDTEATCPRWMKCLGEWSDNDEVWQTLLQRWFGYCLLPHRRYAKWMLMHGKIRAGKGTIAAVLRALMGDTCYLSCSLDDLALDYGLAGLEHTRVLCVSEASELHTKEGERATRVLKNIVGRDPITINAKWKPLLRNVVVNAAPMMQSNEIPRLPNRARGLSSKMLVLPFDVSFEGREQFDLLQVLRAELQGIALWALAGAVELEGEKDPRQKFPMPDRSIEEIKVFHLTNNPMDFFLESRFTKNPAGKVANKLVRREWYDWVKRNKVKIHVADNQLPYRLCTESSWEIKRSRFRTAGDRFLEGLSLKKESDDEA